MILKALFFTLLPLVTFGNSSFEETLLFTENHENLYGVCSETDSDFRSNMFKPVMEFLKVEQIINDDDDDNEKLKIVEARRGQGTLEALMEDEFWGDKIRRIQFLEENNNNHIKKPDTKESFDKALSEYVAFWDGIQSTVNKYMGMLHEKKESHNERAESAYSRSRNQSLTGKQQAMAHTDREYWMGASNRIGGTIQLLTRIFGENESAAFTEEFLAAQKFESEKTPSCTIENKSREVLALEKKFQMEIVKKDGRILISHNGKFVSTVKILSGIKSYIISTSNKVILISFVDLYDDERVVKYYLEDLGVIQQTENSGTRTLFSIDPNLAAK